MAMNEERLNGILENKEGVLQVRDVRNSAWAQPAFQH